MDEAEQVRVRAMESGQLSAAVTAIKEKGVLSGKRVERSEIGAPGEFDHMSDDELRRDLIERFIRLGIVPGLAIIDGSIRFDGKELPFRSDVDTRCGQLTFRRRAAQTDNLLA